MLRLIQSNRTEVLVDQLALNLSRQAVQANAALVPQTLLVQSQGMRQWLTLELARRNGIVANLATPMPATFLWQLCQRLMGREASGHSSFDKLSMSWHIMALLPGLAESREGEPLARYLREHGHQQLPRYQLSYRIADIFDQYLLYRPDWLFAWEAGDDTALEPDQRWQPVLWRALLERITRLGQEPHRAAVYREAQRRLAAGKCVGAGIPDHVAIFGVSSLPPAQMDLFVALGQRTSVEIYALNPCAQYWGDIVSEKSRSKRQAAASENPDGPQFFQVGNPLLASFGRMGRDFFDLLLERDVDSDDHFVEVRDDTLLGVLQRDILRLQSRAEGDNGGLARFTIADSDHSVQLHSCHSPMREVEVLHDQLLAMLGTDDGLRMRDIVVMVPDISAYAPVIHAVFSQPREGVALRYSISDRTQVEEAPVLRAFLALVELPGSRFAAPEIIDLIQTPAIASRFGFSATELARIRHWVASSGIRWGWNADHKCELGLPPSHANSWRFGLDRLLLGYALPEAAGLFNATLASDEIDSSSAELLGRTIDVLDSLWAWRTHLQQDHSWRGWIVLLRQCVSDFFDPDDEETAALAQLLQNLANEPAGIAIDQLDEPIGPPLLQSLLHQHLEQTGDSFGFLSGGINFCTLMPMRSIPFKVVCLLGMNDQQFPRSQSQSGFDLIDQDRPRRGDRNRRNDDRYQMLEAILAARDRLYISYVGSDVRDNSSKLASVLVGELTDYCQRIAVVAGAEDEQAQLASAGVLDRLLTHHHLQPFDPRYFGDVESRWFSYAREYYNAALKPGPSSVSWAEQSLPRDQPLASRLPLERLLAFVANPCRSFLQQRVGIHLALAEDEPADTEVLELAGLDRYLLAEDAQRRQLEGVSENHWLQLCVAAGLAPQGGPGSLALDSLWSDAAGITAEVAQYLVAEPQSISLELELDGFLIEGELGPLHDNRLVHWRPGKFRKHQLLQQWLRHLVANAVGGPVTSLLFEAGQGYRYGPVAKAEAMAWLKCLLGWYQRGMQRALPLLPETCWQWLESMARSGDEALALRQAESNWSADSKYASAESQDPFISRCFSFEELGDSEFTRLAVELVEPARIALEPLA